MWDSPYLNRVRSAARSLGVTKLVGVPGRVRGAVRQFGYDVRRPTMLNAELDGCSAQFVVGDRFEYARLLSYREDARLIRALATNLSPGDVYWDVGSSLGLYALLLASRVGPAGKVVAFEPEERSLERLRKNVAASRCSNVQVVPMALGRERSKLTLKLAGHFSAGNHSLFEGDGADPAAGVRKVDVVPGDALVAEGLPPPTAIKIDVEGAEEEVIDGLRSSLASRACRAALVEVHFTVLERRGHRDAPARIVEHLRACGLSRLRWLDPSHLLATRARESR